VVYSECLVVYSECLVVYSECLVVYLSLSSANSIYQRFKETPPMAYCWEAYAKLRVSMANWYILVIKMKPTQFWF
jgi:hypothetical protein